MNWVPGLYIVMTNSTDEHYNPTHFAIVDLDQPMLEKIEKRWKMFRQLQKEDEETTEMSFSAYEVLFYEEGAGEWLDNFFTEEQMDVFQDGDFVLVELTDEQKKELEQYEVHTEYDGMLLGEQSVRWECHPKHFAGKCDTGSIWFSNLFKDQL